MKKSLLLISLLCLSLYLSAQTAVKITFEDATIGTTGGTTASWGGAVDVLANPVTTGNTSTKVLHANSINYMPIYFGNVAIPAGAETLYSTLKLKILVVGGGDANYPTFNIYSSPDAWAFGSNPTPYKIAAIGYANLWGAAEIGVWKTVEFALSGSLVKPIPGGNLVLNLSKGSSASLNCEYLIDDVELVPAVAPMPVITLTDFETNTIGENLNMKRYNLTDATATVEANPTIPGEKSVHILATNWNSALKLNVALPTGKTLTDYATLSFDIYLNNIDGTDNVWKQMEVYVDDVKKIDKESQGVANSWEAKSYSLDGITSSNSLVMDIGLNTNKGNYYLDNIKITEKIANGVASTDANPLLIYSSANSFVLNMEVDSYELYNAQGARVLSGQKATSINTSGLRNGIYILKASVNNDNFVTKVLK